MSQEQGQASNDYLNINTGISATTPAYVGGNWDNGLHVGTFYCNLNNAVSNSNANIGAANLV